jgi:hypothetical protein
VPFEIRQPAGEDVRSDTQVAADVLEAGHSREQITQDQRRPSLADDVNGPCDRAIDVRKGLLRHAVTVVHCFSQVS